jgi:hypothetical protein
LAYGISHRSTPEYHSGRGIRLWGPKRQTLYDGVSDKNAKSCMRSGEAPRWREPDYKQASAELIPSTYAGFGSVAFSVKMDLGKTERPDRSPLGTRWWHFATA